jgi:DNA-binding YbaB/EbfC family protein
MAKGFNGMPGNLGNLMKQAQKMQADMQKLQGEAETYSSEGTAGGGLVVVTANGKNQILSISIDPKAIDPQDREMLQDMIVAATNDALIKVQEVVRTKMEKITGGMGGIPGLF